MRLFKYFLPKSVKALFIDALFELTQKREAAIALSKSLNQERTKLLKSRVISATDLNPAEANDKKVSKLSNMISGLNDFMLNKADDIKSFDSIIAKTYFRGLYTGIIISIILIIIIKFM